MTTDGDEPRSVAFEPWGNIHELRPGDRFDIRVGLQTDAEIEIVWSEAGLSIWFPNDQVAASNRAGDDLPI